MGEECENAALRPKPDLLYSSPVTCSVYSVYALSSHLSLVLLSGGGGLTSGERVNRSRHIRSRKEGEESIGKGG